MLSSLSFVALVVGAVAVPSPGSLNSSMSIFADNDLQGPSGPAAGPSVMLLEGHAAEDAGAACEAMGEQLWSPDSGAGSIQKVLDYVEYLAPNHGQFWIAPKDQSARAMGTDGHVSLTVSLGEELPVMCTQTAPYSNLTFQDTSEKWQVGVQTNNETLMGYRDHFGFRFLGIRYAPQPERFTYSVPYVGDGSEVPATEYSDQCVQEANNGSEDCLFLNIWSTYLPGPDSAKEKLKPVMFWIHGGAFITGTGNDPTFDGGNLASRGDVVVVAINYRLGTFGFLALTDGVTNGNYGLGDQILALEWVRQNIKDFGGDPERITIFGQSAGGASVRALMASPKSVGKFAGAISQSNIGGLGNGDALSDYYSIEKAQEVAGDAILRGTGCANATSPVKCLQSQSTAAIAGLTSVAQTPVVDGTILTSNMLQFDGPPLPLHLMIGYARDDGAAFIGFPNGTNRTEYLDSLGFGVPPEEVFPVPSADGNETLALFETGSRVSTDATFRCAGQATAYEGLKTGRLGPAVWFYEFNRTYQTTGWPGIDACTPPRTAEHPDGDPSAEYLKCHSGELYLVFGNVARQGLPPRDDDDFPFTRLALDHWAAFARSYDPNPDPKFLAARGYASTLDALDKQGRWMPATADDPTTMRNLMWPASQIPFPELEQCEWLGVGLDFYSET
ncbi:alpha/beta-hydrolase [Hypoxylon sp. FL1284]|nr:alpha/beta-hydrolase [Hypoxylon sp. FL1284]